MNCHNPVTAFCQNRRYGLWRCRKNRKQKEL